MPIAVIALDFDPLLRLGDLAVRWQTVALAVLLAAAIGVAGVIGRRARFRVDDLLYILVGAVPGAVIGGRIGYAIIAPEAFAGGPLALADPAIGGLELGLGVAGGVTTGTVVAAFLGAPVRWWADRLAVVLVLVLAGGKAAMALGGSGQGALSDATWATAYLGAGPWGAVAPDLPSHPAQLYEALGAVAVAIAVAARPPERSATVTGVACSSPSRGGRACVLSCPSPGAIRPPSAPCRTAGSSRSSSPWAHSSAWWRSRCGCRAARHGVTGRSRAGRIPDRALGSEARAAAWQGSRKGVS